MKAITIWQPWASLIMIGAKPYEFRSWACPPSVQGQRIGIHAGARPMRFDEVKELLQRLNSGNAWSTGLKPDIAIPALEALLIPPAAPVLSHMLCTAILGTPRRSYEVAEEFGGSINDSDREEHANFAWPLTAIEPLVPPSPMSGAQGFWNWTP